MNKPVIGVLTWRSGTKFKEPVYFRRLIREGKLLGATVFLFSPEDVLQTRRLVRGFVPTAAGGWISRRFPWPEIVIDRFWYSPAPEFRAYLAMRKNNLFNCANSRLANKWTVHQVLYRDERMRKWLPETHLYSRIQLTRMLAAHSLLYLKPINGTGGRGILKVERQGGKYVLLGRDRQRAKRSFVTTSSAAAIQRANRWVQGGDRYLVQQGLRLGLVPDRSVDMRLLIQKDERGEWCVTGYGIRVGQKQSATSNLHGGGQAVHAERLLAARFGAEATERILAECRNLAHQTAQTIENHFGRMMELGLDIGIDVSGKVWLIEVNPKPGRDIFRELRQPQLYKLAVRRPLQYAMYLLSTSQGSSSFDGSAAQER